MKEKTTLIMEEAEKMIDDEGVFTSDQIMYLQEMLQQISRAMACESNARVNLSEAIG